MQPLIDLSRPDGPLHRGEPRPRVVGHRLKESADVLEHELPLDLGAACGAGTAR